MKFQITNSSICVNQLRGTVLLIALGLSLAVFSCTDEPLLQPQDIVAGDYLTFDSSEELATLIRASAGDYERFAAANMPGDFFSYADRFAAVEQELANQDLSGTLKADRSELANQYPIHVSQDREHPGTYNVEPIVTAKFLSRILNQDRVIRLGDRLYQFGREEVVVASVEDVVDVTDLRKSVNYEIDIYTEGTTVMEKAPKKIEGSCTDTYVWPQNNGSQHRLKTEWLSQEYKVGGLDIIEIWIEIRHQKRGAFGIWFANDEDVIRANGTIRHYLDSSNPLVTKSINSSRNNTSSLDIDVLLSGRSYPLDSNKPSDGRWIRPGSDVTHSSQDGGASASCRIIQ